MKRQLSRVGTHWSWNFWTRRKHKRLWIRPLTKALAAFDFVKDLVQKEWERKIHETSVSSPWLTRLLLDFLLICPFQQFEIIQYSSILSIQIFCLAAEKISSKRQNNNYWIWIFNSNMKSDHNAKLEANLFFIFLIKRKREMVYILPEGDQRSRDQESSRSWENWLLKLRFSLEPVEKMKIHLKPKGESDMKMMMMMMITSIGDRISAEQSCWSAKKFNDDLLKSSISFDLCLDRRETGEPCLL